jgi:prepilin-type N-terminal cleavage/methylation domain-containing protein
MKYAKSCVSNNGFTLIEMLVVIIMVGILSAIAVPSWLSFIERQRLSTSANRVLLAVNTAQSTAKRTKNTVVLATPITPSDQSVVITPPTTPLTFDYAGTTKQVPYKIDLTITGSTNNRYCVVVRSLLGVTSIGKNTAQCAALIAP